MSFRTIFTNQKWNKIKSNFIKMNKNDQNQQFLHKI